MKHAATVLDRPSAILLLPETQTATHNLMMFTATMPLSDATTLSDAEDGTVTLVPEITLTFSNRIEN
jgi:hypothetical protein